MPRRDNAYWQRLRKDKPTAIAILLAIIAVGAPTLSLNVLLVPGPHMAARGNPLYWLILLPVAYWASQLTGYEAGPMKTVRPAFVIGPLAAAILYLVRLWLRVAGPAGWVVLIVSLIAAIAGEAVWRRSMVYREGPAR